MLLHFPGIWSIMSKVVSRRVLISMLHKGLDNDTTKVAILAPLLRLLRAFQRDCIYRNRAGWGVKSWNCIQCSSNSAVSAQLGQKCIWSFDHSGKSPEFWYRSHVSGWMWQIQESVGQSVIKMLQSLPLCWRIGWMGGKSKWYLSRSRRILHFAVVCQNVGKN